MAAWPAQIEALASVAAVIIAVVSAYLIIIGIRQAAAALRGQNSSSDIQTVLTIWERLDHHWNRFRKARSKSTQKFEFGQLVTYYELACSLFRERVLTTSAAKVLEEHLDEILPVMQAHPEFNHFFVELRSREETFANIRWFCDARKTSAVIRPSPLRRIIALLRSRGSR